MIKSQNQIVNSNLNDIFQEMDLNHLAKSQIPIFFLKSQIFQGLKSNLKSFAKK